MIHVAAFESALARNCPAVCTLGARSEPGTSGGPLKRDMFELPGRDSSRQQVLPGMRHGSEDRLCRLRGAKSALGKILRQLRREGTERSDHCASRVLAALRQTFVRLGATATAHGDVLRSGRLDGAFGPTRP